MKSNYKKLGPYIREVNNRDTNKSVELLLGVSIEKIFKPSIANTIGTDMSTYKIVKRNQFAYGPVTSRNGDKISVALLQEHDEAIVSQAYVPFEVTDTTKLDPEYLMMWFRRPEFDRYARFMSHGSAREIFSWEEMREVELPIPHIEKQREIVKEYNTIVNRIKLNEQLCQKLEETAQAIYKQWFVDFEFPDENGLPYKSNGGKMVFNEELEKEIPKGWNLKKIFDFIKTTVGGDWGSDHQQGSYTKKVKCIRGTDIPDFKTGGVVEAPIRFILEKNLDSKKILENHIIIEISGGSPVQSTGRSVLVTSHHLSNINSELICSNFCRVIVLKDNLFSFYISRHIDYLYALDYLFTYENSTTGVKNFDLTAFLDEEYLLEPDQNILLVFNKINNSIIRDMTVISCENKKLFELKDLLHSRLTTIGN